MLKARDFSHICDAIDEKSSVFVTYDRHSRSGGRREVWHQIKLEKCQKHMTFHTFEPKLKKSLVFLTLYDGQAGMSTPRDCRDGARKRSKTRDFSHVWTDIDETSRVFDTLPIIKCQKHKTFHTFG